MAVLNKSDSFDFDALMDEADAIVRQVETRRL